MFIQTEATPNPAMMAMPVPVAKIIKKTVPIYLEYSARTESIRSIPLQAKVSGYIQTQHVPDGTDVKEGDLLYTIDPRGLAVFDSLIDQERTGRLAPGQFSLPPPTVDAENLRARQGAMRDLAIGTDGLALMNSNDFDAALGRIVSDLSTY